MRLLQVIHTLNPRQGGPAETLRLLAQPLADLGHQMDVLTLDAPDAPFLQGFPAITHAIGPSRWGYGYSRQLVPWLLENAENYDAVIAHGIWQYLDVAIWRVMRKLQRPYFVYIHGALDPWFKQYYPLKHLKKWLYWPWTDYWVLRHASAVLFTSEEEKLGARRSFWLYRCNEVVASSGTAPAPTDLSGAADRLLQAFPQLQGKRLILFLSRLHPKKGCDLLIKAFARVAASDANLHLVMAGPDRAGWGKAMQDLAAAEGISDRISWLGMVSDDLKWGAFRASEVFCLPSHQENFGSVVAEALASGLPVLISRKVNIWREIEADEAGLAHDDTVDGTARNLERWLTLSPQQKAEMGHRALACFSKRFNIRQAAERMIKVIEENMRSSRTN